MTTDQFEAAIAELTARYKIDGEDKFFCLRPGEWAKTEATEAEMMMWAVVQLFLRRHAASETPVAEPTPQPVAEPSESELMAGAEAWCKEYEKEPEHSPYGTHKFCWYSCEDGLPKENLPKNVAAFMPISSGFCTLRGFDTRHAAMLALGCALHKCGQLPRSESPALEP